MFLDNLTVILFAIYIYVIFMVIQKEDYTSMLIATLIVAILLCYRRRGYLRIERFEPGEMAYVQGGSQAQSQNYMPESFKRVVNKVAKNPVSVESNSVAIQNDPSLVYNNVSAYDGLCLKTGNKEFWSHSPNNVPLISNDSLYTVMGYSTSEKPVKSDPSSLSGPTLDGTNQTPNKMFMLANNVASPNCCPSTFSTSTGCVCTTDAQRDFVASRGFNNL